MIIRSLFGDIITSVLVVLQIEARHTVQAYEALKLNGAREKGKHTGCQERELQSRSQLMKRPLRVPARSRPDRLK